MVGFGCSLPAPERSRNAVSLLCARQGACYPTRSFAAQVGGTITLLRSIDMGKGDKKTFRGKVFARSYGNARPAGKIISATPKAAAAVAKKAPVKKAAKKA